ncbi:hypothetical protein [Rhodopila globiformis]|uniref:hypothetical protein n=1 Tax=Rhodopila globiformis TaxID=1071 RepID=UPI00130493F4|nr:hypothetical protein [Rhodopila globiformis]
MAEVALKTGILSEPDRARPAVNDQRSFERGLVVGVLLAIPAWAAIVALVVLLV